MKSISSAGAKDKCLGCEQISFCKIRTELLKVEYKHDIRIDFIVAVCKYKNTGV